MALKKIREEDLIEASADDGAVDIVFLLIIFFLVASSFSSESKENVTLAERKEEAQATESADGEAPEAAEGQKPNVMKKYDLRFVLYGREEAYGIKADEQPIELLDLADPLEAYITLGEVVDRKREFLAQDPTHRIREDTGQPEMLIQIWADQYTTTGILMSAVMASVDRDYKPEVVFLTEQNREEYSEIFIDPPQEVPAGEGEEGAEAPAPDAE